MGEKKKARRFSQQFKFGAVERMQAGDSPSALERELAVTTWPRIHLSCWRSLNSANQFSTI